MLLSFGSFFAQNESAGGGGGGFFGWLDLLLI